MASREVGRERDTVPVKEVKQVANGFAEVFSQMPSVRERYAFLQERGLPLSVLAHVDCDGEPPDVGLKVTRGLRRFAPWEVVKGFNATLREGEKIEFPGSAKILHTEKWSSETLRERGDLINGLVPEFLCSPEERKSFLNQVLVRGMQEIAATTDLTGSPHGAALTVTFALDKEPGARTALQEVLERNAQENQKRSK